MPDGRHLPIQDSNDAGLGLVEHEVVDLVVAVDERRAVLGLFLLLAEELGHFVEVGDVTDRFVGVDVFGFGLVGGDGGEGLDLPVVEAVVPAEAGQADFLVVDAVKFRERVDC